jgi:hypothetical protein
MVVPVRILLGMTVVVKMFTTMVGIMHRKDDIRGNSDDDRPDGSSDNHHDSRHDDHRHKNDDGPLGRGSSAHNHRVGRWEDDESRKTDCPPCSKEYKGVVGVLCKGNQAERCDYHRLQKLKGSRKRYR